MSLNMLRNPLRWACLGALVIGLGVARAQGEEAFFARYQSWAKSLKDSGPAKATASLHFPLLVDGHSFTQARFARDPAGARSVFSRQTRARLRAVPAGEVQSFKDRAEFDAALGGCPELPADGPVFEVDVESDHGGPARRFIFGGEAVGYRLYCVARP